MKQTYIQTDKRTGREKTGRHINGSTHKMDKQRKRTDIWTDKRTGREKDGQTHKRINPHTDKQFD